MTLKEKDLFELKDLQECMDEGMKQCTEGEFKEGDQNCYAYEFSLFKAKDEIWRALWAVRGNDPENKKATYDQMFKLEKGGKQFKAMGDWMRGLGHQGPIEMESLERLGEALCNRIFKTRIAYGRQRDDGTHFLFFNNIRVKGGAAQETTGAVDEEEAPF